MDRVYCNDCKYIDFLICRHPSTKHEYVWWGGRETHHGNPCRMNSDNDCKLYKRKWWKFWVK